jgi:hypothetical protein
LTDRRKPRARKDSATRGVGVTGPEGVLIYGAGGHKLVVLDVARSLVRTERVWRVLSAELNARDAIGDPAVLRGVCALVVTETDVR